MCIFERTRLREIRTHDRFVDARRYKINIGRLESIFNFFRDKIKSQTRTQSRAKLSFEIIGRKRPWCLFFFLFFFFSLFFSINESALVELVFIDFNVSSKTRQIYSSSMTNNSHACISRRAIGKHDFLSRLSFPFSIRLLLPFLKVNVSSRLIAFSLFDYRRRDVARRSTVLYAFQGVQFLSR